MNKKVEEKKVAKKAPAKKKTVAKKPAVKKVVKPTKTVAKKVAPKKAIEPVKETTSCTMGSCKIGGKCPCIKFFRGCGCKGKAIILAIIALIATFLVVQSIENKVADKAVKEIEKAAKESGFMFEAEEVGYSLFSKNFYLENVTLSLVQAPGVNLFVAEASIDSELVKMFDKDFKYELPTKSGSSENYIKGLTVNKDLLFAMGLPEDTYLDIVSYDQFSKEAVFSQVTLHLNNFAEVAISTNITDLEKYISGLNTFVKNSEAHQNDQAALEKDFEEFFASLYMDFASFSYKDKGLDEFMKKINPNYEYEKDLKLVDIKHAKDLTEEQRTLLRDFIAKPESVNISWNNNSNISVKELIDTMKAKKKSIDKLNSGFTVQFNGKPLFTEEVPVVETKKAEPVKVEAKEEVKIKVTPEAETPKTEEVKK